MYRNFVRINELEYRMESEPDDTDEIMKQRGFVKVSDEEFDRLFNLYQEILDGVINYKDITINMII